MFSLIATVNNRQLPIEKLALAENSEDSAEEGGIVDLVRTRTQLVKTAILWFAW